MKKSSLAKAFTLIELSIVILVIGILVAASTHSSRVVSQAKITSARTFTQSGPAASIKNLVLWLDTVADESFDDGDEINGGAVSNWYDINPTDVKKSSAASSGSSRPLYQSSCASLNNLPCLKFDGIDDYIDTANLGTTSQTVTYFMVVMPSAISTTAYNSLIMTANTYNTVNNSVHFQIRSGGVDQNKLQFAAVNGTQLAIGATALSAGSPYVLDAVDDGMNVNLYANGASLGSFATTTAVKSLGVLNIASFNDVSRSRYFTGFIAEILIFDRALKTEERQAIEVYLARKWGIK